MKQKLFLLVLLIFAIKSFSQDSKYSLELNFPMPVDKNFIGENYNGIVDLGVKARFTNSTAFNLGASLNVGMLVNNSTQIARVRSYVIQPRVFGELFIKSMSKLRSSVALGYAIMAFNALGTNNGNDLAILNETQSGLNFNMGLSYDISERIFTQVQYDFIKLGDKNEIPDIKFNRNVNILKVGLGYRL